MYQSEAFFKRGYGYAARGSLMPALAAEALLPDPRFSNPFAN
ncbi:MAG: hypothetical protein OSA81_05075 [Longimicrobiales bacterium]|nr:hypothetical protein [Longimicrobiales bacterium]